MIATLHTILRKPNEKQKSIILALGEKCRKIKEGHRAEWKKKRID